MKRFYSNVSVEETQQGYGIVLDGRPVKTKNKTSLVTSHDVIAEHVAQEWRDQVDEIIPDTMPLTQILNTKIDRITTERAVIHATIVKYLDTDLVCYFADVPEDLVTQQRTYWQPWITWSEEKFSAPLKVTSDLVALSQDANVHDGADRFIAGLNDDEFTVLQLTTSLSGSLILGMAFTDGAASAEDVFQASFVEEHYKNILYDSEKYGVDPMLEKKQKQMRIDLYACELYLKHLRT